MEPLAEVSDKQEMGPPTTRPIPVPDLETLMVFTVGGGVGLDKREKRAVIVVLEERLIVQEPVPVQTPDQPTKVEPVSGEAVRVIVELSGREVAQELPPAAVSGRQEMEPPETVPVPVPPLETERV